MSAHIRDTGRYWQAKLREPVQHAGALAQYRRTPI
jgi:hypothetical protein